MGFVFLAFAFIANAIANVLLKLAADKGFFFDFSEGLFKLFVSNVYLLSGIFLFAVNVPFYVIALRLLPLSVAYPVMVGMSFLIANTAAAFFFNEPITWQHLLGYALIIGGITFVVVQTS